MLPSLKTGLDRQHFSQQFERNRSDKMAEMKEIKVEGRGFEIWSTLSSPLVNVQRIVEVTLNVQCYLPNEHGVVLITSK